MEIRDGFIVGIYNYCDAWCARCAFTSYCRVFADLRETEAARAPLPTETEEDERRKLGLASEREAIDRRADAYSRRARAWLNDRDIDTSSEVGDPCAVIAWFHMMIHVKAMRALDLVWLRAALERSFPRARSFVRPAFDEPDEVARFLRS